MAKFQKRTLPQDEQENILIGFCQALVNLKDATEAAQLMSDLLSPQEMEMLALRLKIAEYLEAGMAYVTIQKKLQVSPITVARVQKWLQLDGAGYRRAIKKVREHTQTSTKVSVPEPGSYSALKKRHPMYHWPELLLEEIIKSASQREKAKLRTVLETLYKADMKAPLFTELNALLSRRK